MHAADGEPRSQLNPRARLLAFSRAIGPRTLPPCVIPQPLNSCWLMHAWRRVSPRVQLTRAPRFVARRHIMRATPRLPATESARRAQLRYEPMGRRGRAANGRGPRRSGAMTQVASESMCGLARWLVGWWWRAAAQATRTAFGVRVIDVGCRASASKALRVGTTTP